MNVDDEDEELGLWNPYSKVTSFILYLYSMEFGSPPLYAEMNRVIREMDMSQLKNLGPILNSMNEITSMAEKGRHADDKIPSGKQIKEVKGGVIWSMSGSLLLFQGV